MPSIAQVLRANDVQLPLQTIDRQGEPFHRSAIGDVPVRQIADRTPLDIIEMRRLHTFGYRPDQLWRLLSSIPDSLRSAISIASDVLTHPIGTDPLSAFDEWDEARDIFAAADQDMRQLIDGDDEVGYLEVSFEASSQRRTDVFFNELYAAMHGATRRGLLARFSAYAVDLPAPAPDFLAALLHGLLGRRDADWTQYMRMDCGGRGMLVCEVSRKRFDWRGRIVKVCYYTVWCSPEDTSLRCTVTGMCEPFLTLTAHGVIRWDHGIP
jgi:hypothetical protein